MNEWQRDTRQHANPVPDADSDRYLQSAHVTPEGAGWLASASAFPRSVRALWSARPTSPSVLPCGTAFDVVNLPALFGRRVLERLWAAGPGSGPVAVHRGRLMVLAAPGVAQRLPALLGWEEWGSAVPPLLCHGLGDAVTVPALRAPSRSGPGGSDRDVPASRWVVAPDTRQPWLPGPDVLLWACIRAARAEARDAAGRLGAVRPSPARHANPGGAGPARGRSDFDFHSPGPGC